MQHVFRVSAAIQQRVKKTTQRNVVFATWPHLPAEDGPGGPLLLSCLDIICCTLICSRCSSISASLWIWSIVLGPWSPLLGTQLFCKRHKGKQGRSYSTQRPWLKKVKPLCSSAWDQWRHPSILLVQGLSVAAIGKAIIPEFSICLLASSLNCPFVPLLWRVLYCGLLLEKRVAAGARSTLAHLQLVRQLRAFLE